MRSANRREFLKTTAVGAVALSASSPLAGSVPRDLDIPRHRGLSLTGVHGYASAHSVPAGQRIEFCFSSDVPFRVEVCRLGLEVDDPAGDEIAFDAGGY